MKDCCALCTSCMRRNKHMFIWVKSGVITWCKGLIKGTFFILPLNLRSYIFSCLTFLLTVDYKKWMKKAQSPVLITGPWQILGTFILWVYNSQNPYQPTCPGNSGNCSSKEEYFQAVIKALYFPSPPCSESFSRGHTFRSSRSGTAYIGGICSVSRGGGVNEVSGALA